MQLHVRAHVWGVDICVCKVPYAACMCSVCIYVCREGIICTHVEGMCCMCYVHVYKVYTQGAIGSACMCKVP